MKDIIPNTVVTAPAIPQVPAFGFGPGAPDTDYPLWMAPFGFGSGFVLRPTLDR